MSTAIAPMMTLGPVTFYLKTATFQNLQRSTEYRWATQDRLGISNLPLTGGPAYQYISQGRDTISLDGTLYPTQIGDSSTIDLLRTAASLGIPWPLMQYRGSRGVVLGLWIIDRVDETQTTYSPGGEPRKIDFKLSLIFYGGNLL